MSSATTTATATIAIEIEIRSEGGYYRIYTTDGDSDVIQLCDSCAAKIEDAEYWEPSGDDKECGRCGCPIK